MEGRRDGFVVGLEGEQPVGHFVEVGEVVGGEDLALDGGEVDLHLIEPGSVHGEMDEA